MCVQGSQKCSGLKDLLRRTMVLGLTVSCAGEGRKLRCVLAWARGSNCANLALILRFLRSSCVAQLSLINHLSVDD